MRNAEERRLEEAEDAIRRSQAEQQRRRQEEQDRLNNLISPIQGALWDGQIINSDNNPFTPW